MNAQARPIDRALAVASKSDIARACNQHRQAVDKWARTGSVPARHCAAIEVLTGVTCEDLRPDIDWQRDPSGKVTGYTVPVRAA